jgi:hypothetical protein
MTVKTLSIDKISSVNTLFGRNLFHSQLTDVYIDGVMKVQHVRKLCKEFENGRLNTHYDKHTSRPSTSRTDASPARVEEMILKNRLLQKFEGAYSKEKKNLEV